MRTVFRTRWWLPNTECAKRTELFTLERSTVCYVSLTSKRSVFKGDVWLILIFVGLAKGPCRQQGPVAPCLQGQPVLPRDLCVVGISHGRAPGGVGLSLSVPLWREGADGPRVALPLALHNCVRR